MITGDGAVKAIAVTGKDLVEHARQIHKLAPLATAALGRSLLGCSMIGAGLKEENGSVTLRIKGDGPLGSIISVSDSQGNVRGYLQNGQVELPLKGPGKLDVGAGVGTDGFLTLIKDIGLKEPYVGSVPLVSGEIAEDLTAYFAASEQILRQGADAADVLNRLLEGMEPELLERTPVSYKCYCNRDRVSQAIISLGKEELRDMIDKEGSADLTCQFCDKVYHFSKEELEELLASATKD